MPQIRAIATTVLLVMYGAPGPGAAQELGLPERMERALRDMMEGMEPTLDQALDYMRSLGAIDDPRHYEMPEVLPNGDIIIRRRQDAPALGPDAPDDAPDSPPDTPEGLPYDPEEGIRT